MLKKIIFFFLFVGIIAAAGIGGALYWYIVVEPGEEIKIENIRSILGKESNVYYSDGKTKLGVFFDETHRQYVYYNEIPQNFVNALVASEDSTFFKHFGFDPVGISRAMVANVKAKRIVQGGSTLTQQTAKNLFKRTDRSIEEKLKELLLALRLEYHYTKEQIFEFYANQFYVSGNGHGLGVAARYYFNKNVSDLSLVECAFIAGSVKRPNYYNPFIKKNTELASLAKQRATIRLRYVLDNMREHGMISGYAYDKAIQEGVPFNKGQFGYELDYVMELVRDAVALPKVTETLEEMGVDNISTSGASIITSIDKDLQAHTLYSLRKQLSDLDIRLRGYERDVVQEEIEALDYRGDIQLEKGSFLFGKVDSINGKDDSLDIAVDFGSKIGYGSIDATGFEAVLPSWAQWKRGRWAKVEKKDKTSLLQEIQRGDSIWVSVREMREDGTALLDFEKYPTVQGGALVMQKGAIKSVAGGSENRFFNRAIYGKRTMGSAFKPFLYTAALQLGWNSCDPLWNGRDLFIYQTQPYFPRPDHTSPFDNVSMSWAGIKSENLASIWLVYHLTDHLDGEQFHDLASKLGFAPQIVDGEKESYKRYSRRVRDKYGVLVNHNVLKTTAFDLAVKSIETDFLFEGMSTEYAELADLDYGHHYERFYEELLKAEELDKEEKKKQDKELTSREKAEYKLRKKMLSKSFLIAGTLKKELNTFIEDFELDFDIFSTASTDALQYSNVEEVPRLYRSVVTGRFHFGYGFEDDENYMHYSNALIRNLMFDMSDYERSNFWQKVVLGETTTVAAYEMVLPQIEVEYAKLREKNPYDFEVLSQVEDFRVTVGLHYLIALAKEMGVKSKLEPVLSFPLGSNVVTLLEAVRFYEAIATGTVWYQDSTEDGGGEELAIIERIESEEGDILYQAEAKSKRVVDKKTTIAAGHILENVIKHGTGHMAHNKVRISSIDEAKAKELKTLNLPVPLLGKTGTANNYTNASFLGYVPGVDEKSRALVLENGYAVGVYVGYDDNKQMRGKTIRIAGAAGALPPWISIVNQLLKVNEYGEKIDTVDLLFDGLYIERQRVNQLNIAMDMKNGGLPTDPGQKVSKTSRTQPSLITFGELSKKGKITLNRDYKPFWTVE